MLSIHSVSLRRWWVTKNCSHFNHSPRPGLKSLLTWCWMWRTRIRLRFSTELVESGNLLPKSAILFIDAPPIYDENWRVVCKRCMFAKYYIAYRYIAQTILNGVVGLYRRPVYGFSSEKHFANMSSTNVKFTFIMECYHGVVVNITMGNEAVSVYTCKLGMAAGIWLPVYIYI